MIKIHIDNPATSTSAADSEYSRNYGTLPQLSEAPFARFSIRKNWKTCRKISSYKCQQTKYSSWRFLNIKKIDFDTESDFSNTEKFQVSGFFGIFIKGKTRYCEFFEIFLIENRNSWFFSSFLPFEYFPNFSSGNLKVKFFSSSAYKNKLVRRMVARWYVPDSTLTFTYQLFTWYDYSPESLK